MAFAWIDTREVRSANSQFYALLNDEERSPSSTVTDALRNYEIIPVAWSDRESIREALSV
jgi:hypothetical protein